MNYINLNLEISHKKLYRPVGIYEWKKIVKTGKKQFPPRLEGQPIFYPVLEKEYAIQIARDWNTKDKNSGYCGLVTVFWVNKEYLEKFEVKQVGGKVHKEYWIPAEELEEFNENIYGEIMVVESFYGEMFKEEKIME